MLRRSNHTEYDVNLHPKNDLQIFTANPSPKRQAVLPFSLISLIQTYNCHHITHTSPPSLSYRTTRTQHNYSLHFSSLYTAYTLLQPSSTLHLGLAPPPSKTFISVDITPQSQGEFLDVAVSPWKHFISAETVFLKLCCATLPQDITPSVRNISLFWGKHETILFKYHFFIFIEVHHRTIIGTCYSRNNSHYGCYPLSWNIQHSLIVIKLVWKEEKTNHKKDIEKGKTT